MFMFQYQSIFLQGFSTDEQWPHYHKHMATVAQLPAVGYSKYLAILQTPGWDFLH